MDQLHKALKKYFNHEDFRPGQEDIIKSILHGNDTLAVMPTGGGKSLCYQLPAVVMQGTALVISPLIALMKDQVDALQSKGITAELINSSIPYPEIINRLESAVQGYYKLLYVAPERLESISFLKKLTQIDISFIAVDEAHCISEWGHDFRPAYLNISKALEYIGKPSIIALTATATPEVRDDISQSLKLSKPNFFLKGFDRPNLIYRVENPKDKNKRLLELIEKTTEGSVVIYCGSRNRVDKTASFLKENNVSVEAYHGGMKPLFRKLVQEKFIESKSRVIVATNAFGMGIDKADVRRVIHADITMTLEAYYQEAGRAGRDSKQSVCTILYSEDDLNLQEFFISASYPKIEDFQKVYIILKNETKQNQIILRSIAEIANEAELPVYLVNNIMELLERGKVISRQSSTGEAKILFTAPLSRLKEYLEFTSEDRREVLQSIMRNCSQNSFEKFESINLTKIKREDLQGIKNIDQIIKSFQYDDLLKIEEGISGDGYILEINLPSVSGLPIDFKGIERRKELAYQKLNKVIEYIETSDCKRNFILKYFGETNFKNTCGTCSSCTNDKLAFQITPEDTSHLLNILECAKELENKFQKQTLIDTLLGNESAQIMNFDLKSSRFYGTMSKIPRSKVENLVNRTLKRKFLEISLSEFRPIFVTKIGTNFIHEHLKQSRTKKMTEEKQFDEKLFNRLVKLRTEIAENAGVVPRGIVSDMVLKKITDAKPLDDEDLRNLSGISQLFTEKYGHLFVKEIHDYELGQSFDPSKLSKLAKDTLKLADQGLTFDKIAQRMFNNKQMVSTNLFEAINEGAKVNLEQFFSREDFNYLVELMSENPNDTFKELYRKSDARIEENLFKIGFALAKKELMVRAKNLKSNI